MADKSQRMFTGIFARLYALGGTRLPFRRRIYRRIAEEVCAAGRPGAVLDVGAGTGDLALEILARCPEARLTGVDLSADMVRIAQQRAERAGLADRVYFQVGDAAALPFADGSFDLVLSTASLHHWSRPADSLREAYRVLRPGGEAWVYDLRRDPSREAVRRMRKQVGALLTLGALVVAKVHSSVTGPRLEEWTAAAGIPAGQWSLEERGVFVKLRLRK